MELQKGDRVRHPDKADWGLGQVLADPRGGTVRIFFVEAGEKTLSLRHVDPIKVPPEEAADPLLDNLHLPNGPAAIKYRSLSESKKWFLEQYPEGFEDKKYFDEERDYKVRAHQLADDLLNQQQLALLIEQEQFDEVCQRVLRVVNATNLIFPNEKMALKDATRLDGAQKTFAIALDDFLNGRSDLSERFTSLSKVLSDLNCAKWTIATYFPFLIYPEKYMFIKPTVTQHAAELCGFAINYNAQLNWLTYKSVLLFAKHLREKISDLKPRDMIDVQSFMWCIAP